MRCLLLLDCYHAVLAVEPECVPPCSLFFCCCVRWLLFYVFVFVFVLCEVFVVV